MKQYFSIKLQELRKEHGLSQEALAEILDVSRQSVSKWESGKIYPEIDKIIFLSEYFNISIDELLKEPSQQDIKPERKIINLSKPDNRSVYSQQMNFQPEEQDIMPYAYKEYKSYKIPPVQPSENINIVNGNQKKSKKKIKSGKLSALKIIGVTFLGGLAISIALTAIYESQTDYYDEETYADYIEESADYVLDKAVYVDEDGNVIEYEYDESEILNRIFYYYDKTEKKYIPVLVPFSEYYCENYLMETANVYMADMNAYVDVISFTNEFYYANYSPNNDAVEYEERYTDEDVTFARYYSEQFQKYIQVLMPPDYTEAELEYNGYKMVDIYESDGGIYKTIIKN